MTNVIYNVVAYDEKGKPVTSRIYDNLAAADSLAKVISTNGVYSACVLVMAPGTGDGEYRAREVYNYAKK